MKKGAIICACVLTFALSCKTAANVGEEKRATLLEFCEYCNNTDGLRHTFVSDKYSTLQLVAVARYFCEQENFSDVADYERQDEIDEMVY